MKPLCRQTIIVINQDTRDPIPNVTIVFKKNNINLETMRLLMQMVLLQSINKIMKIMNLT